MCVCTSVIHNIHAIGRFTAFTNHKDAGLSTQTNNFLSLLKEWLDMTA